MKKEHRKKIKLIGYWPDYEQAFFEASTDNELKTSVVNLLSCSTLLPRFFRNILNRKRILKEIKYANSNNETILFQDNRLVLETLKKTSLQFTGGILMRNVINEDKRIYSIIKYLIQKNYSFWSFDESNCNKYNFKFYNQFISQLPTEQDVDYEYDFLFIGKDKGRKETLGNIKENLRNCNYSSRLEIISEKKDISYKKYIQLVNSSKCLIDLVQQNQVGLTLRPLEAAIYRKKLITNNNNIKLSPLYCPSRTLLLTENLCSEEIKEFMSTTSTKLPTSTLKEFTTSSVLLKIYNQALEKQTPQSKQH